MTAVRDGYGRQAPAARDSYGRRVTAVRDGYGRLATAVRDSRSGQWSTAATAKGRPRQAGAPLIRSARAL
ncbi:hypothetical protein [Streptomyces rugosispiralis]|uniref:Uncharacterized protein n=1 Tax=Streptomyces rugosispiralis TaxID=2967341 RepID=A0ABT1V0H4_9ACTN|nr:hypothetical protein [Streptomyces rugosispiralis]MCQ8190883.1 hypothetical protein [Streptomyces rugosispiralis]